MVETVSSPPASLHVEIDDGKYIAAFISNASPMASILFASVYNHLAPALMKLAISPQTVGNAVKAVLDKASAAVQSQVIAFSVPSGFVADIVTELEASFPGFIHEVKNSNDLTMGNALVAVGILPAK